MTETDQESKDEKEDFGKEFGYNNNICIECVHLHHCSDDKVLHFQKKETVHFNNIKSKNELAGEVTQSAKSKRVSHVEPEDTTTSDDSQNSSDDSDVDSAIQFSSRSFKKKSKKKRKALQKKQKQNSQDNWLHD